MFVCLRSIRAGLGLFLLCGVWLCLAPQQAVAQADLVMRTWSTSLNSAQGAGTSLTVTFEVANVGNADAGAHEVSFYYGDSTSFGSLTLMGTAQVSAVPKGLTSGTQQFIVTLPTSVAWGVRYIHFYIDPGKKIPERNDTNNYSGSSTYPARRITITGLPDIRIEVLSVSPASQVAGGSVTVTYRLYNAGYSRVTTYFDTRFYFSENDSLGGDTYLTYIRVNSLNARTHEPASGNGTLTVTVPASAKPGLGHIIAHADHDDRIVNEIEENNNVKVAKFALVGIKPELSMSLFSVSSTVDGYNSPRTATFIVNNSGGANAGPFEVSFYYGHSTSTADLYLLGRKTITGLDPGKDTGRLAVTLLMPKQITINTRYIHYFIDSSQNVSEVNENNNRGYSAIRVTGYPNLQVSALTVVPGSQMPGGEVDLKFTVINTSTTGTTRAYYDTVLRFYYSDDTSLSTSRDTLLGEVTVPTMDAASSHSGTFRAKLPAAAVAGSRSIFAWADIHNRLPEQNNNDNGRRADVTVSRAIADLEMSTWSAPASANGAGSQISISYTIENKGNADADPSTLTFYYSDTSAFQGLTQLTTVNVARLRAGQTVSGNVSVTLPNNVLQGRRTIHYWIDAKQEVDELNETNNLGQRNLDILGAPNLQIDTFTIVPSQQIPGGQVFVSYRIVNKGASRIAANTTARLFFSTDSTINKSDTPLTAVTVPPLLVGDLHPAQTNGQVTITIPASATQGNAYLGIIADEPDDLLENNESDNTKSAPIKLVRDMPDLAMGPWKLDPNSATGTGDSVKITFQVENKGLADAGAFTVAFYYGDTANSTDLTLLGQSTIAGLKAGTLSASGSVSVKLPDVVQNGTRYIHYHIDPTAQVGESTEDNNRGSATLTLSGKPNLKVDVLSISPAQQVPGGKVAVTYRVSNTGKTRLATAIKISFYDSNDATIENSDNVLATVTLPSLAVGASYPATGNGVVMVTLPPGATVGSTRYIGVFVDSEERVPETSETDNTQGTPISIIKDVAELKMASFTLNPTSTGGANSTVDVELRVQNTGSVDAVAFDVAVYYGDTKDAKDLVKLGTVSIRRVDANTTDSKQILKVTLPASVRNGERYLHYWIDSGESIREFDEQNNRGSTPLTITALPNLQVSKFTVDTNVQDQGRDITVTYRLYNAGLSRAGTHKVTVSLKQNTFTRTLHSFSVQHLDAQDFLPNSQDGSITIRIPTGIPSGQHDLIFTVDAEDVVQELLETDNQKQILFTVRAPKPDLQPKQISVTPTEQKVGQSATLSYTIVNLLGVDIPTVQAGIYFSKDAQFDSSDQQVHTFVLNNIKGQETRQGSVTFTLPSTLDGGKGRLFLVLDDDQKVDEFDETNNTTSTAFEVFVDKDNDNVFTDKDCNDNDKAVYPGAPELCDGKDNNCSGKIDDDPRCVCKSSDPPRPCYSGGQECVKQGDGSYQCLGLCTAGKQSCVNGQWGQCVGEVKPIPEVCDGKDNDCNGKVDDTLIRQCYSGTSGCSKFQDGFYRCNAPCRAGLQSCTGGQWGTCTGETTAEKEICDGVDNDCDGQIDNQPVSSKPLERACQNTCGPGVEICQKAVWSKCSAPSCEGNVEPPTEPTPDGGPGDGGPGDTGPGDGGPGENPAVPEDSCYQLGCPSGQVCQNHRCIDDPCKGVSCAADEFCRAGSCVKSCDCLRCPAGKMCVDGACAIDPCSNTKCTGGEVCNPQNAQCRPDPCANVSCGSGRTCQDGKCVDDPCTYIQCPQSQMCKNGQCVGTNCPTPEVNTEPSEETTTPDGSTQEEPATQTDAPTESTTKPETTPTEQSSGADPGSNADLAPPPSGCGCHLSTAPAPLMWLFLALAIAALRRKR